MEKIRRARARSSKGSIESTGENEKPRRLIRWKPVLIIATVLAITIVVAFLTLPSLIFAPIYHSGDIILKGNEILTIDTAYQQEGNIVVEDTATLVFKNASFTMYQPSREYSIEIRDNANLTVESSQFIVTTKNVGFLLYPESTIYVENNATASFNNSNLVSTSVSASQFSRVNITNCDFTYGSSISFDYSAASIFNSNLKSVDCQDLSTVSSFQSGANWYVINGSTGLLIENSNNNGYILCYANGTVTVNNSTIEGLNTNGFVGKICFDKSFISHDILVDNTTRFYFCGNVTINGNITDFQGQMTRNYFVLTTPDKQITVSDQDTGKTLLNTTADASGNADFDLVFTQTNFTDRLSINGRYFSSASKTPIVVDLP